MHRVLILSMMKMFNSFQFYLYIINSQQQLAQGRLFQVKDPTILERNPNNPTTSCEQALGNSGKKNLPFNRKKPLVPSAATGWG